MNPLASPIILSRRLVRASRRAQKNLGLALLTFGLGLLTPGEVQGAAATIYTYFSPNPELFIIHQPLIGDEIYADSGFNVTDDQATRYLNLLNSGWVIGSASFARGMDVIEDWRLHWSVPVLEGVSASGSDRYIRIDDDLEFNFTYEAPLQTVGVGTPHSGEPFRGNSSLVAMDFQKAIFFDSDDTFSVYMYYEAINIGNKGLMVNDYSWNTFTGGETFAGVTLSRSLMEEHFIGVEQKEIALLVEGSVVDYYHISDGSFIRRVNYGPAKEGPLSQHSLADIIDGKVPGYYYLGMQWGPVIAHMVPEPTLGTLLLLAGAGCLRRRRVA